MAKNSVIVKVTLAVLGEKMDNLNVKMDGHHLALKEHTSLDETRFTDISTQLEPLKTFRWKFYGAIAAVTALVGLLELLHTFGVTR